MEVLKPASVNVELILGIVRQRPVTQSKSKVWYKIMKTETVYTHRKGEDISKSIIGVCEDFSRTSVIAVCRTAVILSVFQPRAWQPTTYASVTVDIVCAETETAAKAKRTTFQSI